jgi:hypothetical protein
MASISSVDPNILAQGQNNVTVRILGDGTHFHPDNSTITFSEPLITWGAADFHYYTAEHLEVTVDVGAAAAPGPVTVQVSTAVVGEVVIAVGAITLVANTTPRIVSVDPEFGVQGQTLDVNIEGANTTFVDGVARAVFTSGGISAVGITVNSTDVSDHTHCTTNITIGDSLFLPPECPIGFYDVNVLNT